MRSSVWMPAVVGAALVVLSGAAVLWSADAPPAAAAKEAVSAGEPAKTEPAKTEPAKAEPVKAEPAKPKAAATEKAAAKASNGKKKPEPADNSYCYACHANYQSEKMTKVHQKVGVGCEQCHGLSEKHSGDEDNITPPDKMYPKSEINAFCQTCHPKDKLLTSRDEHRDFFKEAAEDETCTDCHGEKHRLKIRTRQWDKKTGKLLKDDGVRMMEKKK